MPKILANGVNLHYQQVGEGADVVMLHGLTGNLAVWHLKMARVLRGEFRVTTYDLRGHGYSDMPRTGYTTRVMAEDLLGLLDGLGIEKANLVGHSFGADVSLHFALLHPERVAKIVAVEAGLSAMLQVRQREDWEGWVYWREILGEFGIQVPREKWYDGIYLLKLSLQVPKVYGPATGRPRKAEPFLKLLDETTVIEEYENVDGFTLDKIPEIATPTLLVFGENSAFLATYDQLKDNLPNCEPILLPASKWRHFGPLEQPEELLGHMRRFFRGEHESAEAETAESRS